MASFAAWTFDYQMIGQNVKLLRLLFLHCKGDFSILKAGKKRSQQFAEVLQNF